MKSFICLCLLISPTVWSKSQVKNFNDVLIQDVQKDIRNDNDTQFRKKEITRGPASVESEPEGKYIEQEKKIDKNVRQLGTQKW